jgi:hypothetical protein
VSWRILHNGPKVVATLPGLVTTGGKKGGEKVSGPFSGPPSVKCTEFFLTLRVPDDVTVAG